MQIEINKMILHKTRSISGCLWLLLILIMPARVFAQGVQEAQPQQTLNERRVRVHLEEVFEARISLIRFVGAMADYANPVGKTPPIQSGETAVIPVPGEYLPGEFVLRIDYRAKETDHPYPAERIIFVNDQNIELAVNPPYINNDEKTAFQEGEKENTAYSGFMRENAEKRGPLESLRQFLLTYDRPEAQAYKQAAEEFERRREEYNRWIKNQARAHGQLFVSRLFQFQHIPAVEWSAGQEGRVASLLKNYFGGIDFSDPLILRSRELARFMDVYMRLSGMRAKNTEERSALLIEAGRTALEAASEGHPGIYGWMVDYLRRGYEVEEISEGVEMLNKSGQTLLFSSSVSQK